MTLRSPVPKGKRAGGSQPDPIQVGEVTAYGQRVLRKLGRSVNGMRGQTRYALQCQRSGCRHQYAEEGIHVRQRKCPACDGGAPGSPVPEREPDLFSTPRSRGCAEVEDE